MKTKTPNHYKTNTVGYRFFENVLRFRWLVIPSCLIVIILMGTFLPQLTKDTSAEAFVPKDSPALAFRDHVEEVFNLKEPMVIAVTSGSERGIYTPEALGLVDWLSHEIEAIEGIDPDGVISLATEKDIRGTNDGMLVEPFWESLPLSAQEADGIRDRIQKFPLMLGTLVARDGSATVIVAEMLPDAEGELVYHALLELNERARAIGLVAEDIELYVAGQGAVSGYLSAYIAADASRLNPLAAVIITIVLLLAFRTLAGTVLPNIIVIGTIAVGLGSMAAAGIPMYVITNSLPVILIGIAVCDSIHIFTQYYDELAAQQKPDHHDAVVRAMTVMWRPVTLTTLTTVAGFLGLSLAALLPPMRSYGIFAAIGIMAAWAWTLLLLPALLSLFKPRLKKNQPAEIIKPDMLSKVLGVVGRRVARKPKQVLTITALFLIFGVVGISRVEFNDQRIHSFQKQESLRIADAVINSSFDGTYYLDVAITTPNPEDLFQPANLRRIESLQKWMEGQGGLENTTSIVDYIKQMHKSMNSGNPDYYRIPDSADLIAQYFLLYSVSGDPTDFQEEIDYDYKLAHVRGQLKNDNFQQVEPIVLGLKRYLRDTFNDDSIEGHTTGSIDLAYSWMAPLRGNTAAGMALALILVMAASALFFRSIVLGVIATLPVAFSVLMVFAIMGYAGIWIGIGTSMFAAISIGLGVDFSIHTIDRLRGLIQDKNLSYDAAVAELFPSTGRALLFNLLALALGFGVLMTSQVPPLQNFGLLVAIAVLTAFVTSLTSMTALIGILRPTALFGDSNITNSKQSVSQQGYARVGFLILLGALALLSIHASAADDADGFEVMQAVDQRPEGLTQRSGLKLELTDRRGKTRQQETIALRKYYGEDKRQVMFYLEPSNVHDTAFLTYDYADHNVEDDQWLYLPALRKTRRISASDRGDYFLGTDLSYEDLKRQNKVSLDDWRFSRAGIADIDGVATIKIDGVPVSNEVAEELGYGRAVWYVDPVTNTIRKTENWDTKNNHLKTTVFRDFRQVDKIWTVHEILVKNHKTGHQTRLSISNVAYDIPIDDAVFEERSLRRGYRP